MNRDQSPIMYEYQLTGQYLGTIDGSFWVPRRCGCAVRCGTPTRKGRFRACDACRRLGNHGLREPARTSYSDHR